MCVCVRACVRVWCGVCVWISAYFALLIGVLHTGHNYHSPLAATNTLTDTLKKVLEEYKNNLPTDVRTTLIDVLSRSDLSEAKTVADLLTVFVGGFHTSGSCEWGLWKVLKVEDILY